jgi:hypothetical protein
MAWIWCSSAAYRSPFFRSAACRTRPSAACARARPCVRSVAACGSIRLASPFPPVPPQLVAERCSGPSSVLWSWLTSQARPSAESLAFPLRSVARPAGGGAWDLPSCLRGVSVHARGLRPHGAPVHLALTMDGMWPSAYSNSVGAQSSLLSGLNTRPARAPANASPLASRPAAHSSEPAWIATPSPYDSCIRYTSPPFPRRTGRTRFDPGLRPLIST